MLMSMKRFKMSLIGLCVTLFAFGIVEAKVMKQQPETVTTQEVEEQEQVETTTQPKE